MISNLKQKKEDFQDKHQNVSCVMRKYSKEYDKKHQITNTLSKYLL